MKFATLTAVIERVAGITGQKIHRARLGDIEVHVRGNGAGAGAAALAATAWRAANLDGQPAALAAPGPHDCPFIALDEERGWLVVLARSAIGHWIAEDSTRQRVVVESLPESECVAVPRKADAPATAPRSAQLIWQAVWERRLIYVEALLATALVNILTLSTSLYSMQVYDRVIPNRGFQTLWVLSVGVVTAILLELLLKHVRSVALERTANCIDADLSGWFFRRALGIRLDCRPKAIGTLAAQIKGFEMVRGAMSATSLYILADVPFALLFVVAIGFIGGWMALIPVVLMPVALFAGLMFQKRIAQQARATQGQSNQKAGLLVESIDGAESLKANGAEWKMQGRWNRLVHDAGESEYQVKHLSSLSQHLTAALQQFGYIGLVALGAWLVTENELTMGGLIACSILSGRVLSPIAQLPGIMVQWAHAGAATEGLDKIISLPNEIDQQAHALVPEHLDGSFRFERCRFSYGGAGQPSLDVDRLEIKPGEKLGIIGGIGSGKSTLLKLASGLYFPSEGRVFHGGIDMSLILPHALRERIAYLPQDIHLFSGTLRENLLIGLPDTGDDDLLQAARLTGLIDLIGNHPKGLALPITEGGRGISGGQRQLIGLTRMFLAKPAVMLLDEPTASLDAVTEGRVAAALDALAAKGTTLLIATHKTALLPIFNRLLVMRGGRIAMDGPRESVLSKIAGRTAPVS